jgi:hypothetical protein
LAKFKKKKSEPTPEPENSKPKIGDDIGTPEIEKSASVSDSPIDQAKKRAKDKKLSQLFWMRIALAIIAGVVTTFIFEDIEGEERRWASIGFMIILFFASIIVAKGMKMQLPHSDRKKLVTQGIGSYVFLYLFSWIVSYTLTHLGDTPTGINL